MDSVANDKLGLSVFFSGQKNANKFFIVSPEDADFIRAFKWHLTGGRPGAQQYPATRVYNQITKKQVIFYLHRLLLDPAADLVVDHINGNSLDNRRCNLRVCTRAENSLNIAPYNQPLVRKSKKYFGVKRRGSKYMIQIRDKGKRFYKYGFLTPEEAAKAYDELALELRGKSAFLNFP